MRADSLIGDVSDTSFWVAYYRAQETEKSDALFKDPFAKLLIGDRGKKIAESMLEVSQYAEWAVISRTVIIDRIILEKIENGIDAVVNLGAGLDARPYRMNLPKDLLWVEADYPNIINHKNTVLENEVPRCELQRVAVDLANENARKEFLKKTATKAKKILVLTEGVIPYLSQEQVADLANNLLQEKNIQYWIAEYFHPRVYPYLKSTVREMKMKNAPFRFYPEDWFDFFARSGWAQKEAHYTGHIAKEFNRKMPMPWYAKVILPFMPKWIQEGALKMSGYVVFERIN